MRFSLIGNCAYQALIDERLGVQWLCWPRFDSSFVFGGLLDAERAGEFRIEPAAGDAKYRQAYVPNTNILRTHVETDECAFEVVDFAPRFQLYERYYKPTMLMRQITPLTGDVRIRVRCRPVYDYGLVEPSAYSASNHLEWLLPGVRLRLTTNAPLAYVQNGAAFALESDIFLVMTWGEPLEAPLEESCRAFRSRTQRYWETWVKHSALPSRHQEAVVRSALVLKLHQYEDTGAITAAATTSIPESPGSGRNWDYRFCWLRDSWFTLNALRRLGHFEEMEGFVSYLHTIAAEGGDDLQPVYGIAGERQLDERILEHLAGYRGEKPVRAGNEAYLQRQHDVYGEMIAALAPMFLDVRFRDSIAPRSTALVHRLLGQVEQTMERPDHGPWEKRQAPQLYAFSLLMHWVGATAAQRIGEHRGDAELAARGATLAARARSLIDHGCWRPELGLFAEAVGTNDADGSLFMLVNLGFLDAADPRAGTHVDGLAQRLSKNGGHLLYRYVHDDGLGATHATFTVCGFWYAEALARLGRKREAAEVFERLLGHANHTGLLSEDVDPATGEQWGNFPQLYSHVGVINTAFILSPLRDPFL